MRRPFLLFAAFLLLLPAAAGASSFTDYELQTRVVYARQDVVIAKTQFATTVFVHTIVCTNSQVTERVFFALLGEPAQATEKAPRPYPGRLDRGTLIGNEGGRVPGDGTVSIDIPEGAAPEPVHAEVARLSETALSGYTLEGYTILGGFDFTIARASSAPSQDLDGDGQPDPIAPLQLFKPASATYIVDGAELPAPDSQVILAEVITGENAGIIRLTALMTDAATSASAKTLPSTSSALLSTRPATAGRGAGAEGLNLTAETATRYTTQLPTTTLPVDGLTREGTYLVLAANQPIAYATGLVRLGSATGPIAAGARVSTSPEPQAPSLGVGDAVRQTGIYALPIPAAGFALTPANTTYGTGKPYENPAAVETGSILNIPLVLTAEPPVLSLVEPIDKDAAPLTSRIVVASNKSLDPASFGTAPVTVTNAATGTSVVGTFASGPGATLNIVFTPTNPLQANARYLVAVDPSIRTTTNTPLGTSATFSFATITQFLGGGVNKDAISITIPNELGVSIVKGIGSTDPAQRAVPSTAVVQAVRRGHDFITQYQTQADVNGHFEFPIGTAGGNDRVTIRDVIDLYVTSNGILTAIIRLTPFVTSDGLGFIVPPDRETRFTSADGVTVTVPAGAFDELTLVTVMPSDATPFAEVPNFAGELGFAGGVRLEFDGIAKKRLQVSVPVTDIDPAATYYLGLLGQSVRGPRVMIVDTLRLTESELTTEDAPATAKALRASAGITTNAETGGVKETLLGVVQGGDYGLLNFVSPVAFLFVEIHEQVDLFNSSFHAIYESLFYINERAGKIAMPVMAGTPFTITGVDAVTGFETFQQDYEGVAATDPGVGVTVPSPDADVTGPYPVFAIPNRIEVVDLEGPAAKVRGISLTIEKDILVLRASASTLATGTILQAMSPTSGIVTERRTVPADGDVELTLAPFHEGDRVVVITSEADVPSETALSVVFSEPIEVPVFTLQSTPAERDDFLQEYFRKRFTVQRRDGALLTDLTAQTRFTLDSQDRRVEIEPGGDFGRGATYQIVLNARGENAIRDKSLMPLGTIRNADGDVTGGGRDLVLEFTTLAPRGELGAFDIKPSEVHPGGGIKDMALSDGLIFVAALDGGILAYDPATIPVEETASAVEPVAFVPGQWQDSDGNGIVNGFDQYWTVVPDDHGRIFATGFSASFAAVRSYRVEDFIAAKNATGCEGNTNAPAHAVCTFQGTSIVGWRPGTSSALPLSTSILGDPNLVEGIPRKMQILSQDDDGTDNDIPNETYAREAFKATFDVTSDNAKFADPTDEELTVRVPMSSDHLYLTQRITVENLTRRTRYSADATTASPAVITGVITSKGDRLRVRRNRATYAVVSLFGYGVVVQDLNAMESNDAPDKPLLYSKLREQILVTDAAPQSACTTTQLPENAIGPLTFSPEAVLLPSNEAKPATNRLALFAPQVHEGLLDGILTLPGEESAGKGCIERSAGLTFRKRSAGYTHPRLTDVDERFQALGRTPIARFNGAAHYQWALSGDANAKGERQSVENLPVRRDYVLVPGGSYGLLVADVAGTPAPIGNETYVPLGDRHLADVIWIPAGAVSVRVIKGTSLATVVDGAGRILLVDLTRIDERRDAQGRLTDWMHLFPTAYEAMMGSGSDGEVGVDDPRIVWKSEPGVVQGTMPPVIDPHTGIAFTGEVNGKRIKLLSVIDPKLVIRVMKRDGTIGTATSVAGLGIPGDNAVAFRVEVTLPARAAELLATLGGRFPIAVESESVFAAVTLEMPTGSPRAHLRRTTRDGAPAPRAVELSLARMFPRGKTAADTAAIEENLRYQQGVNTWVSPWIVAIADDRASASYIPPAKGLDADGCTQCGWPGALANQDEADGNVYEIWSAGRTFAIRPDFGPASPLSGTPYDYLTEGGRIHARLATVPGAKALPKAAEVAAQNPPVADGMFQDNLYLHSGEVGTGSVDLAAGGRAGMNVVIARNYRSRILGLSKLGRGWDSPLFQHLRPMPNGDIEYRDGNGERWTFTPMKGIGASAEADASIPFGATRKYVSPKGLFLKLAGDERGWYLLDQRWRGMRFDRMGRLVQAFDEFYNPGVAKAGGETGNVIHYLYDDQGNLAQIVDPVGRPTTLTYWTEAEATVEGAYAGLLKEVRDWRGRSVVYEYDPYARLVKVKLPEAVAPNGAPAELDQTGTRRPTIAYSYLGVPAPGEAPGLQSRAYTDFADLAGNLVSVKEPAETANGATGVARVIYGYGDATKPDERDRVRTQTWPCASATPACAQGVATIDYTIPDVASSDPVALTTDLLGQKRAYTMTSPLLHDGRAHVKSVGLPGVPVITEADATEITAGVPVSLTPEPVTLTASFQYDDHGNLASADHFNGLHEVYTRRKAPNAAPGTILVTVVQTAATIPGTTTTLAYDESRFATNVATLKEVARTDAANQQQVFRQRQAPNRDRTFVTSFDTGANLGSVTQFNPQGQLTASWQTDAASAQATDPTSTGTKVISQEVSYYEATDASLISRGRTRTIEAGSAGEVSSSATYTTMPGGGQRVETKDGQRHTTTTLDLDAHGRVTHQTVKDANGTILTEASMAYDANGRLAWTAEKQKDIGTRETRITYDPLGRTIETSVTGAAVDGTLKPIYVRHEYDLATRKVTTHAPSDTVTSASMRTETLLDTLGRTTTTTTTGDDGSTIKTAFGYDRNGLLAYTTDETRSATLMLHDALGRTTAAGDAFGIVATTSYNAWGEPLASTAKHIDGTLAANTRNLYTSHGRLRAANQQIGLTSGARQTRFAWEEAGATTTVRVGAIPDVTTPAIAASEAVRMGESTRDSAGRVTESQLGGATGFNGDFTGSVFLKTATAYQGAVPTSTTAVEPRAGVPGYTTTTEPDALGRPKSVVAPGGYTTLYDFDELGNIVSVTPPGRTAESSTYDSRGLVTERTLQDGSSIQYAYDALGNLRKYTDQTSQETQYQTDSLGRTTKVTYPDGTDEEMRYEAGTGLVAATKDRAGQWLSFVYDAGGNLTEVHRGETVDAPLETRYTWDSVGRITAIVEDDAALEFGDYDLLGRAGTTRSIRYAEKSGLSATPTTLDVHTQGHAWSVYGDERTRWRMPAAGVAAADGAASPWLTWIAEERDAVGNLVRQQRTSSRDGAPDDDVLAESTPRGIGRLMLRKRMLDGGLAADSVYGYADGVPSTGGEPQGRSALSIAPAPGRVSGLLGRIESSVNGLRLAGTEIERDDALRVATLADRGLADRMSAFRYDSRSRLEAAALGVLSTNDPVSPQASPSVTETVNPADFRGARTVTGRLDAANHADLGDAALTVEPLSWTATEAPQGAHQLDEQFFSLDNTVRKTLKYLFAGGRRTKAGAIEISYDENGRMVQLQDAVAGRRLLFTYNPFGRVVGRRAERLTGENWTLEDRTDVLAQDGLPAETTWVWDPVTDRLVAIYATGASTGEDVMPEAGLVRQVLHGDQGYDDPLLVVKRNRVSDAPTTFVPLFDEAGTGSLQAVLHGDGSLAERVLYGDSYGDAPRYLTGAVVDRVSFRATKDAEGKIVQVTIRAHVSEPIVETSVAEGVRLAIVTKDGALVQASEAVPALEDDATIAWTLGPLEWQTLTSTTGGDTLEVALGASLRTRGWGDTPVQAPPSWAKTLFGATSTPAYPFAARQSLTKVTEFLGAIEVNKHDQTTWYEISDLYLAANDESATKLLTGFQAAPFMEPAVGYLYIRARWFDPSTGTWISPDPLGYQDSSNLYAFAGGDPVNGRDPTGLADDFPMSQAEQKAFVAQNSTPQPNRDTRTVAQICAEDATLDICRGVHERIANFVFGDDFATVTFEVGKQPGRNESTAIYVNGVFNTAPPIDSGRLLADFHNRPFDVVWNPSFISGYGRLGGLADLAQVPAINWPRVMDESTKMLIHQIRRRLNQRPKTEPLLVVAHSQGAAILASALSYLEKDELARLDVITYGGAGFAFVGVRSQEHFVGLDDPVVFIGTGKHFLSGNNRWRLLPPSFHPLKVYIDHEKKRSASIRSSISPPPDLDAIKRRNQHRLRGVK